MLASDLQGSTLHTAYTIIRKDKPDILAEGTYNYSTYGPRYGPCSVFTVSTNEAPLIIIINFINI